MGVGGNRKISSSGVQSNKQNRDMQTEFIFRAEEIFSLFIVKIDTARIYVN